MIDGNIGLTVPHIRGGDIVLSNLGSRFVRTGELASTESVMAVNLASASIIESRYGSLHNFQPSSPALPEVVQGVLADYAS